MRYRIDRQKNSPAYMQLYDQIRADITGHVYKYGSKIPSKRLMAEETGVSVVTVEHAYSMLADEGYLEARQKSGFYVCYSELNTFDAAAPAPSPAGGEAGQADLRPSLSRDIDRSAAVFPFSVFARTMRRVLSDYGEQILESSPPQGNIELREALSAYLGRSRGMTVLPGQIVIGSGSEYLYGLIVQMLGRRAVYALEEPCYEKIEKVYTANGAVCEHLLLGPEGILSSELARTNAGVLHVTPFNSYPSGITATASKRSEYVRWAKERHAMIVEDDFDSEFSSLAKAEDTLFSIDPQGSVIYVNTFSHSIAPSVRVGYMVLPADRCKAMLEKISFYSCTVPTYDQLVLAEFIRGGDLERHINRVRRAARQAKSRQEK